MNKRAAELLAAGFFIGMGVGIPIGQAQVAHADPFTCQSFQTQPSQINNIYCHDREGNQQHIFCYTTQFGTTCNSN